MNFHQVIYENEGCSCLACGVTFDSDATLEAAPNCPGLNGASACEEGATHSLYQSGPDGEVSCGLCSRVLTTLNAEEDTCGSGDVDDERRERES